MNSRFYRVLLLALPRDRREQYGDQMALVFADLVQHSSGFVAVMSTWAREVVGILRFAMRERSMQLGARIAALMPTRMRGALPPFGRELRWAWRGFVGRGWRGVVVVALLGVALAANAVVFSAADSFLLRRSPYPHPERLVSIGHPTTFEPWTDWADKATISRWRSHSDVFSQVLAFGRGYSAFLTTGDDGPHSVPTADVEPGLLELLGARPVAGRLFDARDRPVITGKDGMGRNRLAPTVSIISESLAAEQFGGAAQAIGRSLWLDKYQTTVIGVVPSNFRFPTGAERIWTPLDLSLISGGSSFLAQLAPDVSFSRGAIAVRERAVADGTVSRRAAEEPVSLRRLGDSGDVRMQKIMWLLIGAAACLLLIACANVVNLEVAGAIPRARISAIAIALGASPTSILVTALLEGAVAMAFSAALAATLTWQAARALTALLPISISTGLANPIDIDFRSAGFMLALAGAAWLVTTLPVALVSLRTNVVETLRLDTRSATGSARSATARRLLTGAEVALSVVLLVGATLASRSYSSLLTIPKGFNVAGVVATDITRQPGSTETPEAIETRVLQALRNAPFVRYAGEAMGIPPGSGGAINGRLTIDGELQADRATASGYGVDADFFNAMSLPIVEGRAFTNEDPPGTIVIDQALAKRYWPNRSPVGSVISFGKASFADGGPNYTVVGVAAHMRNSRDTLTGVSADAFPLYYRLAGYATLTFVVRLTDESRLADLKTLMQRVTPTSRVRAEFVRDNYAKAYANEMVAAWVMRIFGVLALLVAVTGIYSVMAYMVAGRTREIGLRMALGADGRAVTAMVLNSSLTMVLAGAAAGIGAALIAAQWGSSLLFGVSARDPWIYTGVAAIVIVTAVVATWRPALVASRIDPSSLLRE